VVASGALLFASSLPAALGQVDAPEDVGDTEHDVDTDFTPVAKDTDAWEVVAGARFEPDPAKAATTLRPGSPTSFETDLYDVAMRTRADGLAGGTTCAGDVSPAEVDGCTRVPVIYQYRSVDIDDPDIESGRRRVDIWGKAYQGTEPGYVAAVAWISPGLALAVGGSGEYPRRERAVGEPDVSGHARAWLLSGGTWEEVKNLPSGMTALTAVRFAAVLGEEEGYAGGVGQLWRWSDGRFTGEVVNSASSPDKIDRPRRLEYRVRDIAWAPGQGVADGIGTKSDFIAVTAGCCNADPTRNAPALLVRAKGKWVWRAPGINQAQPRVDGTEGRPGSDAGVVLGPDSYYSIGTSVTLNGNAQTVDYAVLATPGGPAQPAEPDSQILEGDPALNRRRTVMLRNARFVDADGLKPESAPSPRWLVGGHKTTRQALVAGPGLRKPGTSSNPSNIIAPEDIGVEFSGTTEGLPPAVDPDQTRTYIHSYGYFELDAFSLNAIDMVEPGGAGWAVGDRGLIAKVGDRSDAVERQPPPPELTRQDSAPTPDGSAYDAFRPVPLDTPPGAVPSLFERVRPHDELGWVTRGWSDPDAEVGPERVDQVALNSSGSEGWALETPAPDEGTSKFYHFNGAEWRRCNPRSEAGSSPDPLCAELDVRDSAGQSVRWYGLGRIPLEHDGDLENNDDLEALAVSDDYVPTTGAAAQFTVARYRDGRWHIEQHVPSGIVRAVRLGFSTPTDGFAFVQGNGGWSLYRLTGNAWLKCDVASVASACGNDAGRLAALADGSLVAAGKRLYLYGGRRVVAASANPTNPVILHRDPGGQWQADLDPGFNQGESPTAAIDGLAALGESSRVAALGVAPRGDRYEGWALVGSPSTAQLIRLVDDAGGADSAGIDPWLKSDAARDYLAGGLPGGAHPLLAVPAAPGPSPILKPPSGPLLTFEGDDEAGRWQLLDAPFVHQLGTQPSAGFLGVGGEAQAIAEDRRGGWWAAVQPRGRGEGVAWMQLSSRRPEPIFAHAPQPLEGELTSLAAAPNGDVWLAHDQGSLARYSRLTGWDRVTIPGWDTRTVARPVRDLAVAADGQGVAVGLNGRVAVFDRDSVRIDNAAASACDLARIEPPCGTSRHLNSVAVTTGGAAMAGGERMAILWRPPGEDFRAIPRPEDAAAGAAILDVSLPRPDRAYLATRSGEIYRGDLGASGWRWELENVDADGTLVTRRGAAVLPVHALALDPEGRGWAVGDRGLLLERTGNDDTPWRQADSGTTEDMTAVALPLEGAGHAGALAGGRRGLVLTERDGRWLTTRRSDPFATQSGAVVDLAVVPGTETGQTQAWAALADIPLHGLPQRTTGLMHYSSAPDEPVVSLAPRAHPLPDAPARRPDELGFAVFGKNECALELGDERGSCFELVGSDLTHERTLRAITDEIASRARTQEVGFTAFTGDMLNAAGSAVQTSGRNVREPVPLVQRSFVAQAAEPLDQAGAPLFGTIGGQDVNGLVRQSSVGLNTSWRTAMETRPSPWGTGGPPPDGAGGLSFVAVPGTEPDDPDRPAGARTLPGGRARTHYAIDVFRGADAVARLVVADTSQRSLSAADAVQQPIEPEGGQAAWLDRMLCLRGGAPGSPGAASSTSAVGTPGDGVDCTRETDQQAIVVFNTPTYSYGPGANETLADAAAVEAILLRNRTTVAVTGSLGWNGRYWATAPGLHEPCPGDPYPTEVPDREARACGRGAPDAPAGVPGAREASDTLAALGAPDAPPGPDLDSLTGDATGEGILPFVVASSAGGKLADARGQASEGFWRGYTVVRLDRSGDPRRIVVEQRPIFDWILVTAQERTLRPGQRVTLRGIGREPAGPDGGQDGQAKIDRIDSPAITHRYDLVLADPEEPYLPLEDANGDYVPLPAEIATVDRQTGFVRTGRGTRERTYAVAILSVDEKAATYPMVFEPRRSFAPQRAKTLLPPLPRPARAPAAQPPLRIADAAPPPPAQPPATPGTPLTTQTLQPPQPPEFPALPAAGTPPPPPAPALNPPPPPPPPPPAPPVLPASPPAQPLALNTKLTPVAIVPTVNPPAPPPVNPAPPAGSAARKEAKQRQAAVAKSEEGADAQDKGAQANVDLADGSPADPGTASATRRDRVKPGASFTALSTRQQPSAWARGALYGGGISLAALLLAMTWLIGRPRPRRTPPVVPAPAWARQRRNLWR
jgi:hypothetical protein